jgi:hypothetical protein
VNVRDFADELRKWWSFDAGQRHTHSWHGREDFIAKKLPELLYPWQPIKTAPKSGTDILVWNGESVNIARWLTNIEGGGWVVAWDHTPMDGIEHDDLLYAVPTHWMPLPQEPQ